MTRSIFRPLTIGTLAKLVFAGSATSQTAPVVGGPWSGKLLTLLVRPAAYTVWPGTRCASP
jgi:hypothetical protein